jgi:hypothetical protein
VSRTNDNRYVEIHYPQKENLKHLENRETILIFKAGYPNDLRNWKSITLQSIVYRIIVGRIALVMTFVEYRSIKRGILPLPQKGFVPGVNGCGEHIELANMTVNRAITLRTILLMLTFVMRNPFGSASHLHFRNDPENLVFILEFCVLFRIVMEGSN